VCDISVVFLKHSVLLCVGNTSENHDDEYGTLDKDVLAWDLLLISGDDIQSQLSCDPHYWHQFLALPLNKNLVSDNPVLKNDVQNTVTHIHLDSMSFSKCEVTDHVSDSSSDESVVIPLPNASIRDTRNL